MSDARATGALWRVFLCTTLPLAILLVAVVELVCAKHVEAYRWPLYLGGAAGYLANLLAFPMALLMVRLPARGKDSLFWMFWGGGFLIRFIVIGGSAFGLNWYFKSYEMPALLAMMGVFLPGLFAESARMALRFFEMDKNKHG